MNRSTITTILAVTALAFGTGAIATEATSRDETRVATSKPVKEPANKKESAGEYVDDAVITGKVKAAVFEEASLKSAEVNVETYKGVVQLTGFVESRASINKATRLAREVKGVKSVKNDMIVKGKQ
jgi:osmotically-inducible protein OsmY